MYLTNMANKNITINCVDCGVERSITGACKNLAKRCKVCQKEHNKTQARNRYRLSAGVALDKPVLKKKEPKPSQTLPEIKEEPQKIVSPSRTPEEKEKRLASVQRLIGMFNDKATTDDW